MKELEEIIKEKYIILSYTIDKYNYISYQNLSDLFNDTILYFLENEPDYDSSKANFKTYFRSSFENRIKRFLTKKKYILSNTEFPKEIEDDTIEEYTFEEELKEIMKNDILVDKYMNELSYEDIMIKYNLKNINTVKNHIRKYKEDLLKKYDMELYEKYIYKRYRFELIGQKWYRKRKYLKKHNMI